MIINHDRIIQINFDKGIFANHFLFALFQIAFAADVLCSLGNPIHNTEVIISIDGKIDDYSIQVSLENMLSKFMNVRTSIRYNCLTESCKVKIVSTGMVFSNLGSKRENDEVDCLLLYSRGLDSRLSYYLLSKQYRTEKLNFDEGNWFSNFPLETILPGDYNGSVPHLTYIDSFDNEPWEHYCQYFVFMVLALNRAVMNGNAYIAIGLNHDDLFGYDIISGKVLYTQCSQSDEFVQIFRSICHLFSVDLLLPLATLERIDVCKQLLDKEIDIYDSISCIFFNKVECGMCFSCFDKLTGLLAAAIELGVDDSVEISRRHSEFTLSINNKSIMKFKNNYTDFNMTEKLPIDYIFCVLLNRYLLNEDAVYISSSKYSPKYILMILAHYQDSRVADTLLPRSKKLFQENIAIFDSIMKGHDYTSAG